MEGILLVHKPSGWTSFDVVNYVRRIVATAEGKKPRHVKVGHTGTLDPLATGLLILLIGREYTRRAEELSKLDKIYEVELTLGMTSTTADGEGEKAVVSDIKPSQAAVSAALQKFTGHIMQTPPKFSAIKVGGQRAYKLARAGEPVALEPRPVTIHRTELLDYEYPKVRFVTSVSSGTYIRSLAVGIGKELGTGAYMSALCRTQIGNYDITQSTSVETINSKSISRKLLTM